MKHRLRLDILQRLFVLLLGCTVLVITLTACDSSDEPTSDIGYYLMIQPKVPIYAMGGIAPPPKSNHKEDETENRRGLSPP